MEENLVAGSWQSGGRVPVAVVTMPGKAERRELADRAAIPGAEVPHRAVDGPFSGELAEIPTEPNRDFPSLQTIVLWLPEPPK
jgi:hypothetical protein